MEIRFRLPRVPSGLGANLLGLAGLIAVAVAVGGLTGSWWWSILVGGVFAFGLSWIAQNASSAADVATVAPPAAVDRTRAALEEQTREVAYLRGKPATA